MPTYRISVLIEGCAIVKYPPHKAASDCTAGLPRDAESEVLADTPFIYGARMEEGTVELAGQALPAR